MGIEDTYTALLYELAFTATRSVSEYCWRFLITIIIVFSAHKYFIDFFKKMWHVTYQNNP